jgi:hypothetical protein
MNFTMIDKRRLVSYFQATSNEIALDVFCYKVMNVSPKAGNYIPYIPRPTKLLKYANKNFIQILKIFWIYILGHVLFLKQFFSYLIKKIITDKSGGIKKNSSVGIAFSDRAMDIINKKNCDTSPEYWIVFPWTDYSRLDNNAVKVELLSLLTVGELWKACFFAICAHKRMAKAPRYKNWILQSYTSFQWFAVRMALEKIEGDFFIAEHFDRWAVMMDGILIEQRRNSLKSSLVLVQHGLVTDVGDEKLVLPYKLSQFKRLYLYDATAEEYFKENILSNNINTTLEGVTFYDNLISIREIPKTDCINILFVGHSICTDLHVFILNELMRKYDLKAYYKPHPVEKTPKFIYKQKWTVIEDKHFYPAVDILISYPSTLVYEYELLGINAVVHPYDLKIDLIQSYLHELEREMASCYDKKIKFA